MSKLRKSKNSFTSTCFIYKIQNSELPLAPRFTMTPKSPIQTIEKNAIFDPNKQD